MKFAIIGATGNVGRKTIDILEKSKLDIKELHLVASKNSLGKKISKFKFQSLNVMIGKDGDLSIFIKFDSIDRLKKYETESDEFVKELKQTFVFKENQFAGVFVYNYEAEATSSEIKMSNPAA